MDLIFNGPGPVVGVQGNMPDTHASMHNPLLPLVKTIVCDSTTCYSEYDILKKLTALGVFAQLHGDASTVLFQKHFLLMNALYQLRDICIGQDTGVIYISALTIQYVPRTTQDVTTKPLNGAGPLDNTDLFDNTGLFDNTKRSCNTRLNLDIDDKGVNEKLRAYYLDMNNLATSAVDIHTMLTDFWHEFAKWQGQVSNDLLYKSFQELGIEPSASFEHVQKTYRMLVAKHHPDRGGDAKKFIAVRCAYETISANFH